MIARGTLLSTACFAAHSIVKLSNTTLSECIRYAYGLAEVLVVDGAEKIPAGN